MRRDGWEHNRYPLRGEERYTWDPHHWEDREPYAAQADRRSLATEEPSRPRWVRALESLFLRLVVLSLMALVLVQLWQRGLFSQWLQVSRFEGNALTPQQTAVASGGSGGVPTAAAEPLTITVSLVNVAAAPDVRLLVDGREAARFTSASVTVTAAAGAELRLDPGPDARQLSFRVTALSDRDRLPRLGTQLTVHNAPAVLGQVD